MHRPKFIRETLDDAFQRFQRPSGVASYRALGHVPPPLSTFNNFIFSSLWSKSDSQLTKYCVVGEIS